MHEVWLQQADHDNRSLQVYSIGLLEYMLGSPVEQCTNHQRSQRVVAAG